MIPDGIIVVLHLVKIAELGLYQVPVSPTHCSMYNEMPLQTSL